MHDVTRELDLVAAYGPAAGLARAREYDEAFAAGDAQARRLAELAPGPQLAAALVEAAGVPMSTAGRLQVAASWERQAAWSQAQSMAAVVAAAGTRPDDDSDPSVVADLALLTRTSEGAVGTRLGQARHVGAALPATWEALNAGRITSTHAWVLTTVTRVVRPAIAQQVEDEVLEEAIRQGWTPAQLADAARRVILRIDPEGAAERAATAKRSRSDVRLTASEDEMALLSVFGDAWTGRQMMDEINRRADAKKRAGDDRGLGELRVEAVAEALLGADSNGVVADPDDPAASAPSGSGRRPKRATALLLISLSTLLGGSEPGHLDGYGPITAELARRIAANDARFRRLVLDPMTGKPVDLGDSSYELSPEMSRWIEARDRTCRFPRCRERAVFCDKDHAVEWPKGETTCDNCGLLCRRHHNLKTRKKWSLTRNPDGSVDWVSPHGFTWHQPAATYEEFRESDPPWDLDDLGPPESWPHPDTFDDPDPPDPGEAFPESPPAPADDDDVDYDEWAAFWERARGTQSPAA